MFNNGMQVRHRARPEWGVGSVTRAETITRPNGRDQRLWIKFANAGLKTLLASVADLEIIEGNAAAEHTFAARENASECIVSPPSLPTALYVPDAVTPAHEAALLRLFDTAPWTRLRARSLQQYGGSPSAAGLENATPLPRFLSALCASLVRAGVFDADAPPNHVLVNAYAADEGIVAHTDGPCYLPVVATLSLGEDAVMRYSALRRAEDTGADDAVRVAGVGDVVLRARSLVVTRDALYTAHAHEIVADADARIGSVLFNGAASGASAGGTVSRTRTRVSIT